MINIYKLKLTTLQQEILRLLFVKAGASLNQRAVARLLNVSPPAVKKALPKLSKEGFIIVKREDSNRLAISLNRDDFRIMQLKRADNLRIIYESNLSVVLGKEFAGAAIILFGSYSRGEDTVNSDIDIAVVGRPDKQVDLSGFEKLLERKININFYISFDKIHKNLKENLFNGIVIGGSIEL
jgi:predicted nucleotidyltransferase